MKNEIKRRLLPIFILAFCIACLLVQTETETGSEMMIQKIPGLLDSAMHLGLGLGGIVGFRSFKEL